MPMSREEDPDQTAPGGKITQYVVKTLIRLLLEMFEQQVMSDIKLLTTMMEGLECQVASIRQTLDEHLATCDLHTRHDIRDGDHDIRHSTQTEIRRRKHSSEDHKQACMVKSFQKNIILLVDDLPFTESELGDMLISADCLSGDECSDLRRCLSRKDQIRNLVRLIKGRSFKVMAKFLHCVSRISPDIASRIWTTYKGNLKNQGTKDVCTFCSLQHSVDIKLLADHVWSIGAIPDILYDEIVSCPQPTGSHWYRMAKECNRPENTKRAMDVIIEALEKKGHYNDLVPKLRRKTRLECSCFRQEAKQDTHVRPEIIDEDDDSSISPNSSMSDISSHEDLLSLPYDQVLNSALNGYHGDRTDSALNGLRDLLLARESNINLFRPRSNSFGKSSAKIPSSRRRASICT